ncbi:MAG: prefoldin subunit beta [Thermoproteales archaeon]|nr:prefoldin subunit beta [Thermoproteales archaeon]
MASLPQELPENVKADIKRYQDITEKLRLVLLNKQQVQIQLTEVNNALSELNKTSNDTVVFKIVGNLMINKNKNELLDELNERKETLEIRLKSLEKQEKLLKDQLKDLESKIYKKLGGGVGKTPDVAG